MPLTLEEVEHIARLARLELSDEDKARYREQLSAILDHVAKLQELDTSEVPPMSAGSPAPQQARRGASVAGDSHPVRAGSPPGRDGLRADRPRAPLSRKRLLKNAPEVQDDQFKIPPVFE